MLFEDGDARVSGDLILGGKVRPDIPRSNFLQENQVVYAVPLTNFRKVANQDATLPATSSGSDLGLYTGTFGTASSLIRTSDLKAVVGPTTRYARLLFPLPAEYVIGATVQLRLNAGMVTTIADTSATILADAYKIDKAGGIGANLQAGAAITINSLTFAAKTFTLTSSSLSPGDVLDVRISLAVSDAATGTAVIGAFGACDLLLNIKG